MTLLNVRDLSVGYDDVLAVQGVNLTVEPGERVGIVGESGSGKTTLALALMRLLPPAATVLDGSITLDGVDLFALPESRMRPLRGSLAGMVFQDPLTSFDPLRTLGDHLSEGLRAHGVTTERKERAVRALRSVGMPAPESQLARRPHELSGGMRQRGMIALGLANEPRLLIADEPTTALDVTIQAQIMDLFATIGAPGPRERLGLVMVSHNLGLVRQLCTRGVVMYAGRIVEDSPAERFFAAPRHPYSIALRDATPRLSGERGEVSSIPGHAVDLADPPPGCPFEPRCSFRTDACATNPSLVDNGDGWRVACHQVGSVIAAPPRASARAVPRSEPGDVLVQARGVAKTYRVRRRNLTALAGVDLDLRSGETVAVVGESGSGKSTLAHALLGLLAPTSGTVRVAGDDPAQRRSPVRRQQKMQAVFQDPHGSLNPRQRVRDIIAEPMVNAGVDRTARRERVLELLTEVRLGAALADRYPHELSGGQAQRVAIARALAGRPELIVLDEPTASLDVSIQTHVISLLRDLQAEHGLAYLFVSHDLLAVRELADRIAVMYLGRLVELAPWDAFFAQPLHPYSVALLSALPRSDMPPGVAERIVLAGEPPSALDIPAGCPFHPRCPVARDVCATEVPPLTTVDNRSYACHFPGSLLNPSASAPPPVASSAPPAIQPSSESSVQKGQS